MEAGKPKNVQKQVVKHDDKTPEIPDVEHLPRKNANDLKTNYIMTYGQDTLCLPEETTSDG